MFETNKRLPGEIVIAVFLLFLAMAWGADFITWMNNERCFSVVGCNYGFFGYDAIVHFVGGILVSSLVIWIAEKHPHLNFDKKPFWVYLLIVLSVSSFAFIIWELLEFGSDYLRPIIFNTDLLHPLNRLYQPGNSDTIGDLCFGLGGATLTVILYKGFQRLKRKNK